MTEPSDRLWRSLVAHPKHGALPILLLGLTVLTGTIDAVSILSLGRVFVANMTGNVVFVGFALAGAPGFSLAASLFALGGFLVGAAGGGALATRRRDARPRLLRDCVIAESVLVLGALLVAVIAGHHPSAGAIDGMAALAALAMGAQNAVVRALAVPDLTTTVLTMTLTGIAADLRRPGRGTAVATRLLAVLAMLLGAVLGALTVLHVGTVAGFGLSTAVLVAVTFGAAVTGRTRPSERTTSVA